MTIHTIAPINLDNPPAAPESGAVLFVSVAGVITTELHELQYYNEGSINWSPENDEKIYLLTEAQWAAYAHAAVTIDAAGNMILTPANDAPLRFAAAQNDHVVEDAAASALNLLYHTQRQNDLDIAAGLRASADLWEVWKSASSSQRAEGG